LFSGAGQPEIMARSDDMQKYEGQFRAETAWQGPNIASLSDAVVKLRWTDQPFRWHVNDGSEVFVVLAGEVDMHVRSADATTEIISLRAGDLLHILPGEEHVAHPRGEARILVIEESKA
jgi:mannose-6-phosphate isomerase-like protein (cupin superfamily)